MPRTLTLTALVVSTLLSACATPEPVQQAAPADPNCMTRESMVQVLAGQGLTATILDAEQNAAWHAYDRTHSQQPDPAGFTYVIGEGGTTAAVVIGFSPDGCAAYYVSVAASVLAEAIGAGS